MMRFTRALAITAASVALAGCGDRDEPKGRSEPETAETDRGPVLDYNQDVGSVPNQKNTRQVINTNVSPSLGPP